MRFSAPFACHRQASLEEVQKYEYVVDMSLVLPNKPGVEFLTDLVVLKKKTQVRLCPSAGVFVSISSCCTAVTGSSGFGSGTLSPRNCMSPWPSLLNPWRKFPNRPSRAWSSPASRYKFCVSWFGCSSFFLCLGNYAMARQT